MLKWIARIFTEPPVLNPAHRDEIRKLVTMVGITREQQEELYDLCLHIHDEI